MVLHQNTGYQSSCGHSHSEIVVERKLQIEPGIWSVMYHGIIEWLRLEGTLWILELQPQLWAGLPTLFHLYCINLSLLTKWEDAKTDKELGRKGWEL